MKKFFVLMMVAAMSIACGGNNAEKKEGEVKLTVEQQAKAYCDDMIKAIKADDEKKGMKIMEESDKWYQSLSEEDQMIADKVMASYQEKMAEAMGF